MFCIWSQLFYICLFLSRKKKNSDSEKYYFKYISSLITTLFFFKEKLKLINYAYIFAVIRK